MLHTVVFALALLDLVNQLLCCRKIEFILACDDGGIVLRKGHADSSVIFLRAEEDADSGVLIGEFHHSVVVVDIHLKLAKVLVGGLVGFEVDEDEAPEQAVIEDKIDFILIISL